MTEPWALGYKQGRSDAVDIAQREAGRPGLDPKAAAALRVLAAKLKQGF